MSIHEQIEEIKRKIIEIEQPDKIVLFGSYAYGNPNENSDLDILIIKKSYKKPKHKRGLNLYKKIGYIGFPVDFVFLNQKEINEWKSVPMAFITEIVKKGKVIYEKP